MPGRSGRSFVRTERHLLPVFRWSFPRRQQYRRLRRAAESGTAGVGAGVLAVIAAGAGALAVAGVLSLGLLIDARHWVRLAGRSRVGARSEDEIRGALAPLQAEGWRLRHSLPYRGRGDIDSVAIAPTGIAFAIETKTRSFDARHVAGVRGMAAWLHRRRRRWCRRGALPVLCVVRATGVERVQDGVLVVSVDRLVPSLRAAAGTAQRPAFLAAETATRT
jgi:Nuclease-related domain